MTFGQASSAAALLLTLAAPAHAACDKDAYLTATLNLLEQQHLFPTNMSTCDWLEHCTDAQIQDARQRATDIRAFAKTVADPCAKSQLESWAWYVDYEAGKGEMEMRTHKTRDEYAAIDKKSKDEQQRAAGILRLLQGGQ